MYLKSLFVIFGIAVLINGFLFMSVQVLTVDGLVPSIVNVDYYDVGSATWANITVRHTPPPAIGPGHYISNVQLEINGTVQNLNQSPQSTETFTIQYNLGSNTDTYSVRARALCSVHGYSAWSNTTMVPEFSLLSVILFITLTTVASVIVKNTFGQLQTPRRC